MEKGEEGGDESARDAQEELREKLRIVRTVLEQVRPAWGGRRLRCDVLWLLRCWAAAVCCRACVRQVRRIGRTALRPGGATGGCLGPAAATVPEGRALNQLLRLFQRAGP
jgi:hypothetical protein